MVIFSRKLTLLAAIFTILAFSPGCSRDTTIVNNADLPQLNDISAAPANIQTAAKAVVRVHTAGEMATGVFISATGQLLTNNHVLGETICPVEGCYAEITFLHQRGEPSQKPVVVFAVPTAVDAGLDMAVVQLYNAPGGARLNSPDFLTFNSQDSASLIGKHVTIVGHPEGCLKKWTDGVVVDAVGKWFQAAAYALPGDSGSPALDDDGRIVGLMHRVSIGEDIFTTNGANVYSIGSASSAIIAAMNAPLPGTMISLAAAMTTTNFLANDAVFLNARTATVNADGAPVSALSLLGKACDTALARNNFTSPGDMDDALVPCYRARAWIDCRIDASPVPFSVVCPGGSDGTDWANRFKSVNQKWIAMNGKIDYYDVSFSLARLQPTINAGHTVGAQALQQAIAAAGPVLDYTLASYLAAFNIDSFHDTAIKDYVVNYQNVLHYELYAADIANAGDWLSYYNKLGKDDFLSLLSRLYSDPNVDTGSKLYIEDVQYQLQVL